MRAYRGLRVWRKACAWAINTRRATERFPRSGYTELKAQIVSAAESVVIDIIEGCGASSQRDFAHFLNISIKSRLGVPSPMADRAGGVPNLAPSGSAPGR
jgi:hypothetical protein